VSDDDDGEDITSNYHGGDEFSTEAFQRTPSERRQRDRARILQSIREDGPAICEDLEQRLDLSHQTCSARVSELRKAGDLVEIGRGTTSYQRSARIHELAERQGQQ
jgi:hypothetical protein